MAIFKCKMCGGNIDVTGGQSVALCEYCGTKQTISKTRDEIISNLYNRANDLRFKCEFDRAAQTYEKILEHDNTEAEAHWGIVLCRYGIEYVEDPKTNNRIPTCHRAQYEALTADADYIAALQNADSDQIAIYVQQAKAIEVIQKNILEIVKNENPFDVFICYKETDEDGKRTPDSVIANDIYYQLTQENFKVFYAPITLEDKLGQEYEPYIFAALHSAKVMLVIGTKSEYFNSTWVKNEWSRFLKLIKKDRSKLIIPCYRDMDAYDLPDEFAHLQAQDMSKIGFINDVVRGIKKSISYNNQPSFVADNVKNNDDATQLMLNNGVMYEGQTFANVPHGFGKASYKDNSVYEGNWERGKRHGHGKMIWNDGSEWCGEFSEDKAWNGTGVYYFDGKSKYEGEIAKGFRSGKGRYVCADSIYEGEFVNGKRHGMGKVLWNSGGEWQGEFKDDKFWNGQGLYVYKDSTYEGGMVNGLRHGKGKITWKLGGTWEGEFRNDEFFNGYGGYYYSDSYYKGNIVNGKRHGLGKIKWNKGGEWEGEFNQNEFWNGEGVYYYTDSVYKGRIVNGKRHGHGTMTWNKGGEWVGEFDEDNFRRGTGIIYYEDGSVKQTTNAGGCYIATCVYGSYDCPQVCTLRRYRDQTLAKSWYGRLFVKLYYSISPTIVKWFGETKWFKKLWRSALDRKILKLKSKGFNDTPYDDVCR